MTVPPKSERATPHKSPANDEQASAIKKGVDVLKEVYKKKPIILRNSMTSIVGSAGLLPKPAKAAAVEPTPK